MNTPKPSGRMRWLLPLLIVISLVVLWVSRDRNKPVVDSAGADDSAAGTTALRTNASSVNSLTEPAAITLEAAIQSRLTQLAAIVSDHNRPITFFGRVVDQDGFPLEGVKVVVNYRGATLLPTGKPDATFTDKELVSDADGHFQLLGAHGDALTIESITKPGYQLSPKAQRGFTYRHDSDYVHRPDINNPVIYRMWKLQGEERLVDASPGVMAPPTGEPLGYDLVNKRKESTRPDVVFRFWRPPSVDEWTTNQYDWRLEITVPEGGLLKHNDELPYRAPETGYHPKHVIEIRADDPNWQRRQSAEFYLRARNGGLYARMTIEIDSKARLGGLVWLKYAANTNGSRNLEWDPRTQQPR